MSFPGLVVPSFRYSTFLLLRQHLLMAAIPLPTSNIHRAPTSKTLNPNLTVLRALSSSSDSPPTSATPNPSDGTAYRWKPMCLYYSQGKCTKMDDAAHLQVFNHDCSEEFRMLQLDFERKQPQKFDFLLVFDLEGKVEILEFPVLLIDTKTMTVVDLFHRFVRPSAMSVERVDEYIENKYGKFGVDRVWHDTALPFVEVVEQFEDWLTKHHLWEREHNGRLNRAAFVTCGNWDVKTQVPHQCKVSKMKLPPYFMEWINLKDVFHNFYTPRKEARGMRSMMEQLKMQMSGSHHLGIDDTRNIARIVLRMLADGAVLPITGWRDRVSSERVNFLYTNRI
ncbi:Uncharacterized exonuclease domain-containing protein At3g15140 [Linum grandiflorum]